MEEQVLNKLKDLYGLNPNVPHLAFQFPRLPPGLSHPMFKIHENPSTKNFHKNAESLNKKLQEFQQLYQQHASNLMSMNTSGIIPPGHPLFSKNSSVELLKSENDKLLKENLELKKRLEKNTKSH